MDLTRAQLAPLFENIVRLLAPTPGHLDQFEPWANEQAQRLKRSAEQGKPQLALEAELLRDALSTVTGTAQMQLCQRLWLTGLIKFVDDLLEDEATESRKAPHHHLKLRV